MASTLHTCLTANVARWLAQLPSILRLAKTTSQTVGRLWAAALISSNARRPAILLVPSVPFVGIPPGQERLTLQLGLQANVRVVALNFSRLRP